MKTKQKIDLLASELAGFYNNECGEKGWVMINFPVSDIDKMIDVLKNDPNVPLSEDIEWKNQEFYSALRKQLKDKLGISLTTLEGKFYSMEDSEEEDKEPDPDIDLYIDPKNKGTDEDSDDTIYCQDQFENIKD